MQDLKGKCIVVTGAASGIGAATVDVLTRSGADVIAADRNPIPDAPGKSIMIDLSDAGSISAAIAEMPANIQGLCNIAGLALPSPAAAIVAVNFVGTRLFTEQLVDRMTTGATIVNVASSSARMWRGNAAESRRLFGVESLDDVPRACAELGIEHMQSYRIAKEALVMWTIRLSQTFVAKGIRANTVSPGATQTPMLAPAIAASGERGKMTKDFSPRIASAEEVANVIAFLCTDASSAINGANIAVDNGLTAALDQREYGL